MKGKIIKKTVKDFGAKVFCFYTEYKPKPWSTKEGDWIEFSFVIQKSLFCWKVIQIHEVFHHGETTEIKIPFEVGDNFTQFMRNKIGDIQVTPGVKVSDPIRIVHFFREV